MCAALDRGYVGAEVEKELAMDAMDRVVKSRILASRGMVTSASSTIIQEPDNIPEWVKNDEGATLEWVALEVTCRDSPAWRLYTRAGFLVVSGHRPDNPADDLPAPKAWTTLPKFLTTAEVDALLAAPDVGDPRTGSIHGRAALADTLRIWFRAVVLRR